MSVSAQNNDSIKINNFSIEKNAQGDSVSLRFHLMIAPGITKANDELLLTPILIDIKGNHSFAFPVIRVNGKIREKIVRRQKVLHSSKAEKDLIYTVSVSYTHLRAHETCADLVCRLLLEKKK